jgi:hypothetical protein
LPAAARIARRRAQFDAAFHGPIGSAAAAGDETRPSTHRPRGAPLDGRLAGAHGEIFYIIKNGIRFTGMPGWGGDDEENWKLIAFVRHLPHLSPKELELMKESGATPE